MIEWIFPIIGFIGFIVAIGITSFKYYLDNQDYSITSGEGRL